MPPTPFQEPALLPPPLYQITVWSTCGSYVFGNSMSFIMLLWSSQQWNERFACDVHRGLAHKKFNVVQVVKILYDPSLLPIITYLELKIDS